ncbi:MAG: hypothetical protein ACXVLQ_17405 [Bacteriovorax sp.]
MKGSKKIVKGTILGASLMLATSCSSFLPDRSFIEEMNRDSDPYLVAGKDFPTVSGDTGQAYRSRDEIKKRTPASERNRQKEKEQLSLKQELEQKEASIPEEHLEQYTKDKKYLSTDSDKLYYLSLSLDERPSYIDIKKQDMQADQGKEQDFVQNHSIHSRELYLGMDKSQVVQMWGKPSRVEIAGNPSNQNERWSFVEDGNVKQIYFESGKVQGWALDL